MGRCGGQRGDSGGFLRLSSKPSRSPKLDSTLQQVIRTKRKATRPISFQVMPSTTPLLPQVSASGHRA